jgi:hypothetical protein
MDPVSATFYAAVCGALTSFAPHFGGLWMRMGVGALVGVGAAAVFPMVHYLTG